MLKLSRIALAVATAACIAAAAPAGAQNYPNTTVKLIVPVPAGGVTDTMARIVAQRLTEMWGQSVIVENRPGGNYGVGAQAVSRAPADGLTPAGCARFHLHRQSVAVQQAQLRSERIHTNHRVVPCLAGAGDQPIGEGRQRQGPDRFGEGPAGQAELWLVRGRHLCASQHGGLQAAHRHRHRAYPLSRRGAGDDRPPGGRRSPCCCSICPASRRKRRPAR